jgi:hypothetical protein
VNTFGWYIGKVYGYSTSRYHIDEVYGSTQTMAYPQDGVQYNVTSFDVLMNLWKPIIETTSTVSTTTSRF